MATSETVETVAIRRRHAREELMRRGVLKGGDYPPGMRLVMRIFPRLKPPYYGDRAANAAILGTLFALPMGAMLIFVSLAGENLPIWAALLLAAGGGAFFGWRLTGYTIAAHRRLRLTPWDQLDHPAPEDPP